MKINKIKEMSSPDLVKELGELKQELFKLRFSLAMVWIILKKSVK